MRKHEGNIVGILGTVIIHLIAGIIFMSFQLKSLQMDSQNEFEVEFAAAEENDDSENLIELPVTSIEKILQGDEEMLNIARNLANEPDVNIDPDNYIDRVKEELMESGKLGEDNFIDQQKRINEMEGDENIAYENDGEAMDRNNEPNESQEMAADYNGPTRIYYNLEGRTATYMPIPIYKCQGAGKIVLTIEVNRKGTVEKARVIADQSSTSDPCLLQTAVNTASISRFNSNLKAPKTQVGTLTYHFVAQ